MNIKNVVTIGSATLDVFVESDDANIVSVRKKDHSTDFMSYPYGSKLEITDFDTHVGGGGVNTAVNFANLGLNTSAIFKVGDDIYSKGLFHFFGAKNVNIDSVIIDKKDTTGFSIILVSFEGDRTVLAHRGSNAHLKKSDINFDLIKNADLLYMAPLSGDSNKLLDDLVKFAKENNTKVCFNAGTTGIKKGFNYLKKILASADVVVMNKEEASMATGIMLRQDTKEIKFSQMPIHPDLKEMFKKLKVSDYQIIVITDGGNGAYAYDGHQYYFCPIFDSPVVSTLGAGDAFASTFCAAMGRYDLDILKSLQAASINSSGVVSVFPATEGQMTFEQIEEKMAQHPDYKASVIEKEN
ncbi:MAG: carbohydrate kinase family protein [Cyanobacteriota bacterium]|nr:carbohydrate kinase family protein [Cyanobacteriota bacterium]MDY6359192.1 carbohydrate kinase family protein [Cyanobacteriota bacterium]MDY6364677.1 carbohydrate kinase family protein [Cyanobacteriota bacterium]MDY6383744.1 carbohydrate kinase family protein [Cyanobacteriota bacterium]